MLPRAAARAVGRLPAAARPLRGLRAGSTVVPPARRPEPDSKKASRPRDLQTAAAARDEGLDHAAHAAHEAATIEEAVGPSRSHYEDWMVNLRGEDKWLAKDRDLDWYTGKLPLRGQCPGVDDDGCLRSLPMPNLDSITRKGAQDYFDNSWALVEVLFAGFKGEEPFYRPPVHGLRHPQIFYYGHTPCLYVNKLRVAGVLDGPVNEKFESIFEVGVDEMLWDDMHKNDMVWPTVAEVREYRKQVYKVVSDVIATHPLLADGTKVTWDHPMWSLFMSFEHERIHLETSSVLFRETPVELMQVPAGWPAPHPSAGRPVARDPQEGVHFPANRMLPVDGTTVELGKPREHPSYGFDNEYGSRTVQVPDFRASEHMVTNGEFWHFVKSGGYRTQRYWSEDGWGWRKYRNMKWPFFWETDGPEGTMRFKVRTIFDVKTMQWDWPVDVNYHEAKAYCAWKSEADGLEGKPEAYRVITEAEHGLIRPTSAQPGAARAEPLADRAMWASGQRFALASEPGAANLNHAHGTQSPVDALPASPTGHRDAMGNAWEWTEDHFNPLPGFEVHRVYDDFSAPCFDGRHHMIMGGSFMSSGAAGGSAFCRYHFRQHFLQHSGFRLVSSSHAAPATLLDSDGKILTEEALPGGGGGAPAELSAGEAVYETRALVDQYLGLHFPASGREEEHGPVADHCAAALAHAQRFPQRVAQLLVAMRPARTNGRALDLGCAVGGATFELAAAGDFDEVVGIDFSQSFVEAARQMRDGQEISFRIPSEGDLGSEVRAVHEPHVDAAARARTVFQTGDACRLSAQELGTFDGAVLANLLCRLPEPLACLDGLRDVLNPGGVVVIVTPFSWLEQWTARSRWLGGYRDEASGRDVQSKDRLAEEMGLRGFEKIHEEQMPLVIREHRRKYQYIVSEATAWRRL